MLVTLIADDDSGVRESAADALAIVALDENSKQRLMEVSSLLGLKPHSRPSENV